MAAIRMDTARRLKFFTNSLPRKDLPAASATGLRPVWSPDCSPKPCCQMNENGVCLGLVNYTGAAVQARGEPFVTTDEPIRASEKRIEQAIAQAADFAA
ncbi:hypothetical protein [Sphingomicrobium arenosum]|uniref:hypothetical protein n=1 Tax=Sphingomicrobium arenosum TaxID=2233861 RepID=UPI00223F39F7|nr:hypothetical protein [Sphingomicrobium arenosum]